MDNPITLLKGLGLGAALMYYFDPNRGASRRAKLGDQATRLINDIQDGLDAGVRDAGHRAYGLAAEAKSSLSADHADDRTIAERVRSAMGREVSNARAIMVACREGVITLRGPILAAEVDGMLECASRVRGVREVVDRLEVHEHPGNHPALQGGSIRGGSRPELMPANWSPATRLMVGAAGAVAGLAILRRSGLTIPALGLAGAVWGMSRVEGDPLASIAGAGRREMGYSSGRVRRGGMSGAGPKEDPNANPARTTTTPAKAAESDGPTGPVTRTESMTR